MNRYSDKKVLESVQTIVTRRHQTDIAHIAWTDGSCDPNPGPGGWGYMVEFGGQLVREDFGGETDTSNNRMEMRAIIEALDACGKASEVIVRTDSQLVVLCAVGRWKKRANLDLWAEMADLCRWRSVVFEWWRGHIGTPGNERADCLANQGRRAALEAFEPDGYDDEAMAHLRAIASGS